VDENPLFSGVIGDLRGGLFVIMSIDVNNYFDIRLSFESVFDLVRIRTTMLNGKETMRKVIFAFYQCIYAV
jgi:hypothetical protein